MEGDDVSEKHVQQMEQCLALGRDHSWPVAFLDVRRVYPDAILPQYKSTGAAGADLCAYLPAGKQDCTAVLMPGEIAKVGTGIAMQLPSGCHGMIKGRSSNAVRGVDVPVGTLDCDYTGEIHVILYNFDKAPFTFEHGDRIGQLIIVPTMRGLFGEVDDLKPTERGPNGFGSTGAR
jgi:dUTP pyrophosphatase